MVGDRVGKRRSDRFTISVTQRTLRNLGFVADGGQTAKTRSPSFIPD
jgi:hypothetical protein